MRQSAFRLVSLLAGGFALLWAAEWPEFRGPTGQGLATGTGLPVTWSDTRNIRWKTPLPGLGWSSPVVANGRVWLTTATERGRSLRVLAVDLATGRLEQDIEVFRVRAAEEINSKNSHASPTPVFEDGRLWVHFGSQGTACLRESGEVLWKTTLPYESQHGSGGSPVLFEDLVLINCDGTDVQYVAALDRDTGKVRWKKPRPDGYQAYATQLVIETPQGPQLISPGAHRAIAYEPRTGKELWFVRYGQGFSNVPRPVYGHGLVFIATGFFEPRILAVRPGGSGDVTESRVAWSVSRGAPHTPSPILVGDEIYLVSDRGIASCLDARTGKLHWQERLGGDHSASPTYADGRLYFLSEQGDAYVVAPGTRFQLLATNPIGERTFASLAVAGKALLLRSEHHLYRIEDASGN